MVGARAGRLTAFGLVLGCFALAFGIVFGPVLFHDRQFAFQDAGHYYYPLLQRIQQEWDAGRWPLWAPETSAGMPLLGYPTAAVLYPGKLVFAWLPFPWAMRLYLTGHVALAFAAQWTLLRGWGTSATGSTLGALAYAFGVPVLSETSNMIFLVGAAWAPLGLFAADRWVRRRRRAGLPLLALVLALQVLGGDPEAAYVTLVCAGGYAAGLTLVSYPAATTRRLVRRGALGLLAVYLGLLGLSWWSARAIHVAATAPPEAAAPLAPPRALLLVTAWGIGAIVVARRARRDSIARAFTVTAGGLAGAAVLALAVSGAQFLPIVESAAGSFRAAELEGFHDVYPYSAHPLQLLDAVWPGAYGRLEGGYRSWLNALPPKRQGRLWMPSLYLGGGTLVLASVAAGLRGGPPWRAWLSLVAVLGLLAALGYHASPLLWARCVPGWDTVLGPLEPSNAWRFRNDGYLRDGDGGVYWLLASALPGFLSFRYPAKLFVITALAISGLAGLGWDRLVAGRARRAEAVAGGLLIASLFALAASWLAAAPLRAWFDALADTLRSSDEPLNPARAVADLRAALTHGAVVAAGCLALVRLAVWRPRCAGALASVALALDLGLTNAEHIVTVPQQAFEGTPRAWEVIAEAERANPAQGPFRVQRVGYWWPTRWSIESGLPRDFETITRWERNTLRPYYELPLHVPSTFYLSTLEPLDYGLFFLPWLLDPDEAAQRTHGLKPGQKVWYYPRRGFDLWNTRYFIVPARLVWDTPARGYAAFIPHSTFIYPPPGSFDGPDGPAKRARWGAKEDFRVLRNDAAFPRAWIVHRAALVAPVRGRRVADSAKLMRELLYQGDEFWRMPGASVRDPRRVAWVETDRPKDVERFLSRAEPNAAETVTATRDDNPQRVELTAVLRSPGLVVVADRYAPGWELSVDGRPAPILRTNRAMRGVALPAGTHRLVFRYRPLSFRLGIALSVAGLTALAGLGAWALREPLRSGETAGDQGRHPISHVPA